MSNPTEQKRAPSCAEVAELLPVYLNRSLGQAEAHRVGAHLENCAACRQEERDTRTAWDLYEGHLPVELLLDYALAQPMSARRLAVVESHLAECERCAEEVATVRQEAPEPRASDVTTVEPARFRTQPAGSTGSSYLRTLAWAACLATVVASAGWVWTWRQLVDERARPSPVTVRANLSIIELLPTTAHDALRHSATAANAPTNAVELPAGADEVALVLLSGGRGCESTCTLEIYKAGEAQPKRRIEGLTANPDGHVTLALPSHWLASDRLILVVRDQGGEMVIEYLIER